MTYADRPKLETAAGGAARFLALTDFGGLGVVDEAVVASVQLGAESWIDGFIPVQYSPPIASPSEALKDLAAEETVYRLRAKREMVGQAEIDLHKAREHYLEAIRSGRLRPDTVTADKSAAVKPAVIPLLGCTSRDGLKGMW